MTGVIRHVTVRGRVQGVGYRAFVADEADARSLEGWVRNCRDASSRPSASTVPSLVFPSRPIAL